MWVLQSTTTAKTKPSQSLKLPIGARKHLQLFYGVCILLFNVSYAPYSFVCYSAYRM